MSSERVLLALALLAIVGGAALGAGCLADEGQPGGTESATQPAVPDTGGSPPWPGETTLPIPIPVGS